MNYPPRILGTVDGDARQAQLEATLAERGGNYGSFMDNSRIAQELKAVVRTACGWEQMATDQKEAVDMILSKISRLSTGKPDYTDNWHDIAGYASLVETRLHSPAWAENRLGR